MDTEVTKLIEALRSISNVLEDIYGKTKDNGPVSSGDAGQSNQSPQGDQTTVMQQPVHQLPVALPSNQPAVGSLNNTNDRISGSFDNLPVLSNGVQQGVMQNPQVITPTVLTDKDRIKQLEQELSAVQRQNNVNFNFAPVTIGGTPNGQGNNRTGEQ